MILGGPFFIIFHLEELFGLSDFIPVRVNAPLPGPLSINFNFRQLRDRDIIELGLFSRAVRLLVYIQKGEDEAFKTESCDATSPLFCFHSKNPNLIVASFDSSSLSPSFSTFVADLMVDGWLMHLGRQQGKWTAEKRALHNQHSI